MAKLKQFLSDQITYAQSVQKEYANNTRMPFSVYKIGDKVYLNTKNLCSRKPSKKLNHKTYGPYKITKFVGHYVCKLELPTHSNAHPVFYVYKLRLVSNSLFPSERRRPPPFLMINDVIEEWEWKVDKILDSKKPGKKGQILNYLIKWKVYAASWKPPTNLLYCAELLEDSYTLHLNKPRIRLRKPSAWRKGYCHGTNLNLQVCRPFGPLASSLTYVADLHFTLVS